MITRSQTLDSSSARSGGYVLGMLLQLVLVLLIVGQVVFLASRYRYRVDLTSEGYYTLTESTRKVLARLKDRLQIEAYFSPDSQLSGQISDARRTLRNLLDEYVQNGRGRVVVQYFDPNTDTELRERATRLGIKPTTINQAGDRELSYKELWQGLRLRYGGRKQKVIEQIQPNLVPFVYEMTLTPAIKALTIDEKPRIAMVSYPGTAQGGPAPDYRLLREVPDIKDRYNIFVHPLAGGALIPEDVQTLLLVRPKDLTDREKYVLDQFLMRGGRLVVFADTDEYTIGQQRMFNRVVTAYDKKDSEISFLEMMESYGAKIGTNVLIDDHPNSAEPMTRLVQRGFMRLQQRVFYPYWFHALPVDWAEHADAFAKGPDGSVDAPLAENYRNAFKPGIDEMLAKGVGAPGMYWPCEVDLAEELPEGVTGTVLLRTSPRALEESPPQTLDPYGRARQPAQAQTNYQKFHDGIKGRLNSEPRRQFSLMVALDGEFKSFFNGKERPLSAQEIEAREEAKQAEAEKKDPLEQEVGDDPAKTDESTDPDKKPPADPDDQIGPMPEEQDLEDKPKLEPDPILASTSPGRLVVIGDADCIRDDIINGTHNQGGGPFSRSGPRFFLNLLDWLAEDQDLFALRNKSTTDRTLRLISEEEAANNVRKSSQLLRDKEFTLRALNICIPPVLLVAFGFVVFVRRRMAKRTFLEGLES